MNSFRLMVTSLILLGIGCLVASDVGAGRNYNKRLEEYGHAIRWSDFDTANAFVKPTENDDTWAKAADMYKDIRVADYVVENTKYQKKQKQVLQTVEILYYRVNNPTIRTFIDRQRWEYDTNEKEWYLMTGLPTFN